MNEHLPRVASAIIRNEHDEVLLIERVKQDTAEDGSVLTHSFPGGRVEQGETDLQAAVRETLEETGYLVEPSDVLYSGRHHQFPIHMTYTACRLITLVNKQVHDTGVKQVLWVPRRSLQTVLKTPIHPTVMKYLDIEPIEE